MRFRSQNCELSYYCGRRCGENLRRSGHVCKKERIHDLGSLGFRAAGASST